MNRFFTLLLAASCLTAVGQEGCVDVSSTFDFSALYLEADYYAADSILYYYVRFYPDGMGEYWQLDPASTLGVLSFEYSLCEQNGNIFYTDSFLYEAQVNANGVFEGTTNTGEPFTFTPVREGSPFETETNNCGWQPDGNGDNLIGVNDLLDLLGVYGDTDYDQDGIWDSADDCVGEYDACGVCNGSGPSIPIIESIEILYDSVYAEPIDEWLVFEVGADTTYQYVCGFGCTDPLAENYNESVDTDDGSCFYPWACGDPLEYQGYDYETVQIGEQCWFAENLRAENYENGEAIIKDVSTGAWADLSEGACIGRPDSGVQVYGLLYNWYATQDSRGICPSGWDVPRDTDFSDLFDNYETFEEAGGALKSAGSIEAGDGLWHDPNLGATNESGFSAIPSGQYICNPYEYSEGNCRFDQLGYFNYMWTRTEANLDIAKHTNIYSYVYMTQAFVSNDKRNGLAIRCIKD